MRPHNERLRWILQITFDVVAIVLAWALTVRMRVLINPIMTIQLTAETATRWAPRLDCMVSLWLVAAWWLKLYSSRGRLSGRRLLLRAAEASVLVVGLTIITTFFSRGFGIGTSRSFVLLFGPISLTTLILARALSPVAAVSASRRWALRTSVAVLGSAHQATRLANR